ncbi:MAG: GH3 auxin-responsive promoter family protein [Dehalococcoidales bacterium]|nr:GH3 auxin-responsive promoter family protein [Dehalococcoidales bacterium]
MSRLRDLLTNKNNEELWQLCCGFIDLDIDRFMATQKSLLLEQIELLKKCKLGKRIFRGAAPSSVDEFRRQVPLTVYSDYCPDLVEKRESVLPARPVQWIQTLGKAGEYRYKWVPLSQRFWEEAGLNFGAVAIFGSCRRRGEIAIRDRMKILYAASGAPYLTNAVAHRLTDDIDCRFLPSLNEAETSGFEERVEKGFNLALSEGMDGFFGVGGVLVAIGLKFKQHSGSTGKVKLIKHPRALFRLTRGLIRSKRAGRNLMPRDLWRLNYIMSMGTDSIVYKDKIEELWGRTPLDVFGNTETTIVATQTWDYKDMVFFPNLNFLEFIPENECTASPATGYNGPSTLLLDEVRPGQLYELVITSFHGGALVRYRTGNLVRITALENSSLGIKLPQMMPEGRVDDLIDLSFIRLNERIIWQALENTGIQYKEWIARKEIEDVPKLHLYIELAEGFDAGSQEIEEKLYRAIKEIDGGSYVYGQLSSIESLMHCKWINVTILPRGLFSSFKNIRKEQGAALTELKPSHVNPSEGDLLLLGILSDNAPDKKVLVG